MAKKSNYVFPIERNTALEVIKIVKNFYLLEGASSEELFEKRKGLSTQLLLGGFAENVITQELLNEFYANINNEETLINLVKEKFQSLDYENALFLLRYSKDSQSPYYPRMQGEKPVEQFNEDYEFSKNLFIAYINDHGLTSIKNLPGRVVRLQKDIIIDMANRYRSEAIDEARKVLTTNQEALVELRNSIKEQKQKIADLKAANPDAQTSELEAKLKEDRHNAIERYKIVKGQRRSLRDTLEEKAILYRDFADVVGGKSVSRLQMDAEREEYDEKVNLEKKVLDLVKKSTDALQDPTRALEVITLNIKGKFNEKEAKEILGEDIEEEVYTFSPTQDVISTESVEQVAEETSLDTTNNSEDTSFATTTENANQINATAENNVNIATEQNNPQQQVDTNIPQPIVDNGTINGGNTVVTQPVTNNVVYPTTSTTTDTNTSTDSTGDNGQEMFNAIYNQTLEESQQEETQQVEQPQENISTTAFDANGQPITPNTQPNDNGTN